MSRSGRISFSLALVAVASVAACDGGDARFASSVASDFSPAQHAVSVFGVYRDGRMSLDGWEALAPRVLPTLGWSGCDPGYEVLASSDAVAASTLDDYAREEGPTDELLAAVAKAARGDLVLVLTFAGKLPAKASLDGGAGPGAGAAPGGAAGRTGGRGGMRGGGRSRGTPRGEARADTNVLDIAAQVFSVQAQRSVAELQMEYSGSSVDDALAQFARKLGQLLPGTSCAGWNFGAKLDLSRLQSPPSE